MFDGEKEGGEFQATGDPPRRNLIGECSSVLARGGGWEDRDGKGLDGEGFPEGVGFGRTEKIALVERIKELEKELYDYQYHMGLLLIEKMRAAELDELKEGFSEARENLKPERAEFISGIFSAKQTQEQIPLDLEAEKQHAVDDPSCQEDELKRLQNYFDVWKMYMTCDKMDFNEVMEEVEKTRNVLMNVASMYREAGICERQQNIVSKDKEAESMLGKLAKKGRDLLATEVKLPTRETALQLEKQVFNQELESERKSLGGESEDILSKLRMQNAVEEKYKSLTIDDQLAHKIEVETDKVRVQMKKDILNTLNNRVQKFKEELMKTRDILLSLPKHCKAGVNCSTILSEIDLANLEIFEEAEFADDILLTSNPNEHLEMKHINGQNDYSSPQSKVAESVKIGGCIPCLQQGSDFRNFNSCIPADGNAIEASDVEIWLQPMISHDNLDSKRVESGNGVRKIELIENFPEVAISSEQYSDIANDALESECQLNASSINEQNESYALSSKAKRGRPEPIKRTCSLKALVKNSEETLEGIPKEIKQLQNCGSEDLKDANEKNKLNSLDTDKMAGSAEQQDLLCHAPGTSTFEIDSYDRKIQLVNEGHRKRQKTFGIQFGFPGQMRYNFRPSTMLKALMSKLHSEHVVFRTDSNELDADYEPSNSD